MTQLTNPRSRHKRDKKKLSFGPLLDRLKARGRLLIATLKLAKQISRERRTLSCLNEHQLRDIGLTREQINTELGRGIFDISEQRYNYIGLLQGGLSDSRRKRITRLPKD